MHAADSLIRGEDVADHSFSRAKQETIGNCKTTWKTSQTVENVQSKSIKFWFSNECRFKAQTTQHVYNWPARMSDILLVRIALAVSPAPRAFPTRAHAAAWIPRGNYGSTFCKKKREEKKRKHSGIRQYEHWNETKVIFLPNLYLRHIHRGLLKRECEALTRSSYHVHYESYHRNSVLGCQLVFTQHSWSSETKKKKGHVCVTCWFDKKNKTLSLGLGSNNVVLIIDVYKNMLNVIMNKFGLPAKNPPNS